MSESVTINGTIVWFKDFGNGWASGRTKATSDKDDRMLFCALTRKRITDEDPVSLVICNYVLFPNCIVLQSELDALGGEKAAQQIKDRYDAYKKFRNEYPEWRGE